MTGTHDSQKMTAPSAMEPVTVTVIGGGSITGGPSPLTSGTVATTPAPHQPDVLLNVIPPLMAVLVRFVNSFLTVLLGLVTGAMATNVIPAADFFELLWKCAGLSVAGATVGALKDLVTIFGRMEEKWPLMTGNV